MLLQTRPEGFEGLTHPRLGDHSQGRLSARDGCLPGERIWSPFLHVCLLLDCLRAALIDNLNAKHTSQAGQIIVVKHANGFGRAHKPLMLSKTGCSDFTSLNEQQQRVCRLNKPKSMSRPRAAAVCAALPALASVGSGLGLGCLDAPVGSGPAVVLVSHHT